MAIPVSDFEGTVGIEEYSHRVQPHSPGLADRVWYGGGLSSAVWAGQQGINYMTSSVVSIEGTESQDFGTIQAEHIDAFRAHHPHPDTARVCHGLVVIPTDSASQAQIDKYRAYAASRFERTKTPQGPRGMVFSADYVGTSTNSPTPCTPTPASSAPTRSRSRCRSPSTTRTTSRSSPIWPRSSDLDSGGHHLEVAVKFVLEVDLSQTAEDPRAELGRILRYWGGAMKQLNSLAPGDRQDIYDSAYNRVGSWAVSADTE